ncbi:hypothetical protein ACIA58_23295 [Kribbella sp. NPDC051586]|uniref:hypothetical protein n=1 Tax=Kribbella sp. NPDC051586 TaxID=3364118 RepID=UPI00379C1E3A
MYKLFVAAPLLFIAYGIVRWMDGTDGEYGPGLAWTIGHLLFLAGFLLFALVLVALRRMVTRSRAIATIAMVVGLIGVLAFVRVIVIDLLVGFDSSDHASMSRVGDRYDRWPGNLGIYDAVYSVGPMLFLIGFLTLTILLVRLHRLPIWAPAALVLGFAAIIVNLTLMPLGGALLLAALLPLQRPARDLQKVPSR